MASFTERPFAYVVSTGVKSEYCHFCLKLNACLQRCSRCKFAYYCDARCQKSAWPDHADECVRLQKISPNIPTDSARLIARIISKQKAASKSSSNGRSFDQLMSHVNDIKNDAIRMEHFEFVYEMLRRFIGENDLPTSAEVLEIYGKVCINSFNISTKYGHNIGVGIYLQLSLLDHSCDPDAVVVFDGANAILNFIKPGFSPTENVQGNICYIDLLATTAERQQQLFEQYYFECRCNRCTDETRDRFSTALRCRIPECSGAVLFRWLQRNSEDQLGTCDRCSDAKADIESGNTVMQHIKWSLEEFDALKKAGEHQRLYEQSVSQFKEASTVLFPTNVYLVRLLDFIFDACIEIEKWQEAVEYGQKTLSGYRHHYPSGHPALGHQIAKIGKILQYLSRLEEAEVYLQQAVDEAKLSHGDKHPYYSEVYEMLCLCREERRVQLSMQSGNALPRTMR